MRTGRTRLDPLPPGHLRVLRVRAIRLER
jgi:hypothetical protein